MSRWRGHEDGQALITVLLASTVLFLLLGGVANLAYLFTHGGNPVKRPSVEAALLSGAEGVMWALKSDGDGGMPVPAGSAPTDLLDQSATSVSTVNGTLSSSLFPSAYPVAASLQNTLQTLCISGPATVYTGTAFGVSPNPGLQFKYALSGTTAASCAAATPANTVSLKNLSITWEASAGSISPTGLYTPPADSDAANEGNDCAGENSDCDPATALTDTVRASTIVGGRKLSASYAVAVRDDQGEGKQNAGEANPAIASVSPATGSAGTWVTVIGSHFNDSNGFAVYFGTVRVCSQRDPGCFINAHTLYVQAPSSLSGTVEVSVDTRSGNSSDGDSGSEGSSNDGDEFTYGGGGGGQSADSSTYFSFDPVVPATSGQPFAITVCARSCTAPDTTFHGGALLLDQTGSLTVTGATLGANAGNWLQFAQGVWAGNVTVSRGANGDHLLIAGVHETWDSDNDGDQGGDNDANQDNGYLDAGPVAGTSNTFGVTPLERTGGTLAYVTVSPLYALVPPGFTQELAATAYDQNGASLAGASWFWSWSAGCGANGANAAYVFTAPSQTGACVATVQGSLGGATASATAVVRVPSAPWDGLGAPLSRDFFVTPNLGAVGGSAVAGWTAAGQFPVPLLAGQADAGEPGYTFAVSDQNPYDCAQSSATSTPCDPYYPGAFLGAELQAIPPGVTTPPSLVLPFSNAIFTAPAVSGPPGVYLNYLVEYRGEGCASVNGDDKCSAPLTWETGAALVRVTSDPREALVTVNGGGHPSATATVWTNGAYIGVKSWQYTP